MSTWHQRLNVVSLWHSTKWTVVTDPPEDTLTLARFDTYEESEKHLKMLDSSKNRLSRFSYILSPIPEKLC